MRWLAAGALLCALVPATAHARPRAAIAFLPSLPPAGDSGYVLDPLAVLHTAIGMTSPTVGGFDPRQMALDMGQGTRIPERLYPEEIGPLRLRRDGSEWKVAGWEAARRRARDAPGDLVPGLLGAAAGRVAYAGSHGQGALGAIVAADRDGRVDSVSLGSETTLAARALREWARADLLVADLPRGQGGFAALRRIVAARGPDDLVYVVQTPTGDELRLLPSGLAAPGVRGQLRSDTTRRDGLIAATDVGPTVLEALDAAVPGEMEGQVIDGRGGADTRAVQDLAQRLEVVTDRRGPCLLWFGAGALGLLALLTFAGGGRGTRAALRVVFLGGLWLPVMALGAGSDAPGRLTEAALVGLGSLVLGALTDRLVRWPAAPALPAAVVFTAHAADLAAGSPLIARSIAGPNPAGGARFFGIGNELEVILSVTVLVGAGAALAWFRGRPRAPVVFGVTALVAAAVMGAGRLGADVGAVITLAAGGAAAVLASLGRPLSRRALTLAVAAPFAAVALLIAVDLATGGGAHLTRSVVDADSSGELSDVIERRVRGTVSPLGRPGKLALFAAAVLLIAWLVARRKRLLAPLARIQGGEGLRAGLIGALAAVVIGSAANDSGPLMLEIGAVLLALAAAYAWARPPELTHDA